MYLWTGIVLAAGTVALLAGVRPTLAARGPLRVLDAALVALLGAVVLQAVPLPAALVGTVSPARQRFVDATTLAARDSAWVPLTLDTAGTVHAFVSLFSIVATFWIARAIFARGGIRTFSAVIAWGAIVLGLAAVALHASGTTLVYGVWPPRDAGARPLGPFINRNHFGTWSVMAMCLCAGYLQWRGGGASGPAALRARLARMLDGRRLVLQAAIVLLAAAVGLSASRSALVALACAAGYVALAAPASPGARWRRLPLAVLAASALVAVLGYGDGPRLLLRMEETRTTGMANRVAIWRDSLPVIRDFPVAGVGAGAFGRSMRVYQTTPRTYYHNEAHNQYLQLAVEGGVLLAAPAVVALLAFGAAARDAMRRRDDALRWMRVAAAGALVGVAVQSIWETGLTLPANGMFAAALAALLVHGTPIARTSGSRPRGERL